jgi:hypothetical protein
MDPVTLGMAKADAKKRYVPQTARSNRYREAFLQPVTNRTSFAPATLSASNGGAGKSNGTDTGGNYRQILKTLVPFHAPRFVYTNSINNNGAEADGDNAITIRAAIELPGGAGFIPVTFGGQRSVTIQPGATVQSDPVGFSSSLTSSPNWYIRTNVSVASAGMTWPLQLMAATNDQAETGTAVTDKTTSGTIATAYLRMYGPAAVLGVAETETPSVAICGDSIAAGYNHTYQNSFLTLALDRASVPYINLAAGSEVSGKWGANQARFRRAPLLRHCTHVIFEDGINSFGGGLTFAQVQATQQAAWDYFKSLGLVVIQTTITPRTTSTDSWATAGNQTLYSAAENTIRTQFNAWVRTLPAPLSGYIEAADTVESARDSGKWKTDGTANKWTSDGIHPSTYAHDQLDPVVSSQISAILAANPM